MASRSHAEGFQPPAHYSPSTPVYRTLFFLRLIADLQTASIYRDLNKHLRYFSGRLLDIGCGNSPFRHLLDPARSQYQGIDITEASSFGYRNPDVIYYDGNAIPFPNESFDALLCTEVLEHVADPSQLIEEMHRVLRAKGVGIITVPWAARFHYQPFDYHRYTPSMLQKLFRPFNQCAITPRGTDLSSIASKIVVCYIRNLIKLKPTTLKDLFEIPIRLVAALIGLPVLMMSLVFGHCGILFSFGSVDDPLGYTVLLRK